MSGFRHVRHWSEPHPSHELAFVAVPDASLGEVLRTLENCEAEVVAELSNPLLFPALQQEFPRVRLIDSYLHRPPIAALFRSIETEFHLLSKIMINVTSRTLSSVLWFLCFYTARRIKSICASAESSFEVALEDGPRLFIHVLQQFDERDTFESSPNPFCAQGYGKGLFIGLLSPNGPMLTIAQGREDTIQAAVGSLQLMAADYRLATRRNIEASLERFIERNLPPDEILQFSPNPINFAQIERFLSRAPAPRGSLL